MLQIETTQNFDATKHLGCDYCPLHNNCNKYALACDFIHNKLFFGANLLCILERAENSAMNVIAEVTKNKLPNPLACAETTYKDFLPAVNNFLNAFYKYESEQASEYAQCALFFALAESLEYWNQLQYFDLIFSQDVEKMSDLLHAQFDYEMTRSENETLAVQKTNTKRG